MEEESPGNTIVSLSTEGRDSMAWNCWLSFFGKVSDDCIDFTDLTVRYMVMLTIQSVIPSI